MKRRQMLPRIERLHELVRMWPAAVDRQRRQYLAAVRKAKGALKEARAALADALDCSLYELAGSEVPIKKRKWSNKLTHSQNSRRQTGTFSCA